MKNWRWRSPALVVLVSLTGGSELEANTITWGPLKLSRDNAPRRLRFHGGIWVVLKIMGPFRRWAIIRHLVFRGTKMGPHFWELPIYWENGKENRNLYMKGFRALGSGAWGCEKGWGLHKEADLHRE